MTGFDSEAEETNPEMIVPTLSGSENPEYQILPAACLQNERIFSFSRQDWEEKTYLSPSRKEEDDEDDLDDEDDEFNEDDEDEFEDEDEFNDEEPVNEDEIYEEDFDFDEDEDLLDDDEEDVPYN